MPDEMTNARALAERLEDAGASYEILDDTIRSWATSRDALEPGPLPGEVLGRLDADAGELAAALGQPVATLRAGGAHTDDLDRAIDRLVAARAEWESVRWLRDRLARWERHLIGCDLDGGAYRLVARVRGEAARGLYRGTARSDGGSLLVTVTGAQASPLSERRRELGYKAPGIARLRHIGPIGGGEAGERGLVGMVEEEPPGVPSSELPLPMPPEIAAHLARQIARSLAAVHAVAGPVRFLRPELIYVLEEDGALGLGGIAPRAEAFVAGAAPCYGVPPLFDSVFAAPEVVACAREITPAADVFSLAAVVGFWLTGQHPFAGDTPVAQLGAIAAGRGRMWSGPVALGMVLADSFDPDPAARPTLGALAAALERAAEQS